MLHLCLNTHHRDGEKEASQYGCGHSVFVCAQHGLSPPHLTRWRSTPLVNRRCSREVIFTFVGDWVPRGRVNLVWRHHHLLLSGDGVFVDIMMIFKPPDTSDGPLLLRIMNQKKMNKTSMWKLGNVANDSADSYSQFCTKRPSNKRPIVATSDVTLYVDTRRLGHFIFLILYG